MRILALDSSTAACSAAIWQSGCPDGQLIARRYEAMARGQSEALAPMAQAVLQDAGLSVRHMDSLAVTTGPGAFTGVRIGLAMARALGVSAGLPVVGVPTLLAVAHGVPQPEREAAWTLVIMDTKREDIYVQLFDLDLMPATEPEIIAPEGLSALLGRVPECEAVIVVGDAVAAVSAYIPHMANNQAGRNIRALPGVFLPDAAVVAEVAAAMGLPAPDAPPPAPIYLRPPYAKISPTGGRLRP